MPKELLDASNELVDTALAEISAKYDSGDDRRAYHNSTHTEQVVVDSSSLAHTYGLNPHDHALLRIAAAFHDIIHNGDSNPANESDSADYVAQCMIRYPCFSPEDIQIVRRAVLTTTCSQKYPKIIQTPLQNEPVSLLVCDADLASFGKPFEDFYPSAMRFFTELHPLDDETSEQYRKFIQTEITLLTNNEYWSKEARKLFPHIAENVTSLKAL